MARIKGRDDIVIFEGGRRLSEEAANRFRGGPSSFENLDRALARFLASEAERPQLMVAHAEAHA